jgi:hypothetical protein
VRACPTTNQIAGFVAAHPALFAASGWAHHPYDLIRAPDQPPTHRDAWLTLGNLKDLSRVLRHIRARYQQPAAEPVALYLTRFLVRRAEDLDQAEYLTWRTSSVHTLAQTGKPADDAYALPVWLPSPRVRKGRALDVWGLVRAAPEGRHVPVSIQVRTGPGHPWQRVATRTTTGIRGYLSASVHVRRSGQLRLAWNGHHSRAARFRVRAT